MRAVAYRLRSVTRQHWRRMARTTLLVATICATVVAIGAGAHRTATAPDRYTSSSTLTFDVVVTQDRGGPPRTSEVAALPGVVSVDAITFVFGGLIGPQGELAPNALMFSGSPRAADVHVINGRAPDPHDEHDFVATQNWVDDGHAALGDSFEFATLSQEQADRSGFTAADPQGPRFAATLVGVIGGPATLDDPTPTIIVSSALLDEPGIGVKVTLMAVDLASDVDRAGFRTQLDTLPDGEGLSLAPAPLISAEVRRAVQTQARALWLLTLVTAVAATAVTGQLITRQVRPTPSERERLTAIGFTTTQIVADAMCQTVIPITAGAVAGAGASFVASGLFPMGFVQAIEPAPGLLVDWTVIVGGAVVVVLALGSWTLMSLTLIEPAARAARPTPAVDALAARSPSPTAAIGLRLAFGNFVAGRGPGRGAMVGVVLAIAGVTAAATFGASLDRLVQEPFRFGSYYDATVGGLGADALPDGLVERLDQRSDVTSLATYADAQARVGERTVPILGMDLVRGEGAPVVIAGRLPSGDDEIALGMVTAKDLGVHIGDDMTLVGQTAGARFRVTGVIVVPGLGPNDGLGTGGVVAQRGLARIDTTAQPTTAAVQLTGDVATFGASVPELADLPPDPPFVPAAIANVARVRSIPFALAALSAALAVLTIGNVMVLSTRASRRTLMILRSLGAGPGWIARTVHWQATLFTLGSVTFGVPIGIIVGRLVFGAFARNMGAVDAAAIPFAAIAAGAVTMVVLANVAVAIPARRARRLRPTTLLRAE